MREQIKHNMSRRSQALQNAVTRYNNLALKCSPPKPTIDWRHASHYEFIQDFVLLSRCRPEVLSKKWTNSTVRFTMKQQLKFNRAKEELVRCEVECRRFLTYIMDQDTFFREIIEKASASESPGTTHALVKFIDHRRRLHATIKRDLDNLISHPRYQGSRTPGIRKNKVSGHSSDISIALPESQSPNGADVDGEEESALADGEGDDTEYQEMDGIIEFISHLSLT